MGRSMIALFIAGFFCMFIAFTTGVVGCWKTAPGHIVSSAIMMLLACKYTIRGLTKFWNHSGVWPKFSLVFEEFKFKISEG